MLKRNYLILAVSAAALGACAGTPQRNTALEEARSAYTSARNDPNVVQYAPEALNKAREELAASERLFDEDAGDVAVGHRAYLSKQNTAIAREATQMRLAEQAIKKASGERDQLVAESRISQAQTEAQQAQAARDAAQAKAEEAQRSQRQLTEQMQAAEAERQAEMQRQREAEIASQQAAAKARIDKLTADLQAKQTERGLVLTLGDILFDLNKAELKPGAQPALSKLAQFLREYPERTLLVEGFTDSTGSEGHNQELSEDRANSVRQALMSQGLAAERIQTTGFGEARPVASNETAAGRQQNRRVEVVISNGSGGVAGREGGAAKQE